MQGLAQGSAVQAVLFYGIEGAGKAALSRILSKAWLCRNPGGSPDVQLGACGECQACIAFERGRSADYLDVVPAGLSRIIRIGAITETEPADDDYPTPVQSFLRTPPLSARHRVVVIHESERLNPRAANSLLKTLEEPPPYGRFILLTESVGSILPTILSRCLAVACELPREVEGFEPWALALAAGAPGRAREIQDLAGAYRPIYDFAEGLAGRGLDEALVAAEEFDSLAESLQEARKLGARAANAEALEVLAAAYAATPGTNPDALHAIVEAHRRILGNANPSSVFDALFMRTLSPEP